MISTSPCSATSTRQSPRFSRTGLSSSSFRYCRKVRSFLSWTTPVSTEKTHFGKSLKSMASLSCSCLLIRRSLIQLSTLGPTLSAGYAMTSFAFLVLISRLKPTLHRIIIIVTDYIHARKLFFVAYHIYHKLRTATFCPPDNPPQLAVSR